MSSEVHQYIETALDSKKNLFDAEVINFPSSKKINISNSWQLYNKLDAKEDGDQLRTVIGICFIFSILTVLGIYSNL